MRTWVSCFLSLSSHVDARAASTKKAAPPSRPPRRSDSSFFARREKLISGCSQALCEVLSRNASLMTLDVSTVAVSEDGSSVAETVGAALARNKTLRYLSLSGVR